MQLVKESRPTWGTGRTRVWIPVAVVALVSPVLVVFAGSTSPQSPQAAPGRTQAADSESVRSWPKDDNVYYRSVVAEDLAYGRAMPESGPTPFVVDVVINNTNPNLTNTDTANDGETSIARSLVTQCSSPPFGSRSAMSVDPP